MRRLLVVLGTACCALLVACTTTPATPTAAPAPTTAPAKPVASPAPSPAVAVSPAASPAASPSVAAKPAASPAASPASSPAASPAASPLAVGSPVAIPQMILSGTATPGFALTSTAFKDGDTLPTEFTCTGAQMSPPLAWTGTPGNAKAFTLVVQDMDVPPPNGPFVHWIIYNIPGSATALTPGLPQDATLSNGAMQGINSTRAIGYLGACPPPGAAPHHYAFQLFATDAPLTVKAQPTIVDVQQALQGHSVAQTQLRAMFGR